MWFAWFSLYIEAFENTHYVKHSRKGKSCQKATTNFTCDMCSCENFWGKRTTVLVTSNYDLEKFATNNNSYFTIFVYR